MTTDPRPHNHVAIIGTGFGGIATAIGLEQNGFDDIVLLDRARDVGGVWRDNDYPGAAVDIQSDLYSLSFAPNPDWHSTYATQPELHSYLRDVTERFGLRRKMILNCAVERLDWDTAKQRWQLQTANGPRTANHVVIATGALADPVVPDLPGLDRFSGISFHSARWEHDHDLSGKKVAVIGTGPSAVQFVPAIQPTVADLTVFQRTPAWVVPRHNHENGRLRSRLYRTAPVLQRLERLRIYLEREWMIVGFQNPALMKLPERKARKYLEKQVRDPELRAKLLPDFRFGCKRVLISDDYLRSLTESNASVVTDGIREVDEHALIDVTGARHPVDAIIFGTGFRTSRLPLTDQIHGPDGPTMAETWGDEPAAYLGTAVAGFPNCYLIHGPNVGLGHNSVIHMIESQAKYITSAVSYANAHGFASVEPTRGAQEAFIARVDRLGAGSVWTAGGCHSWYLNDSGRNTNIWPGSTLEFRRRSVHFDPTHHLLHRQQVPAADAVAS
ncbi:MAG TPA: NAD(P)/FAD-dependent oxidoreductase [Pseudonocardiaceae bacterium]|nr:NAD(P)/FAD-dependent oxidoreductase [Pseudonocardiaceae bacterium]